MIDDDLFRPTVATSERLPGLAPPWQLGSQLWIAFFGGFFALFGIALLNAQRLGMDWRSVLPKMLLGTLCGWLLVSVGIVYTVANFGLDREISRYFRWAFRAGAMLLYVWFARLQRAADRRFDIRYGDEAYASLWGPGFLAVLIGGSLQAFATFAVVMPALMAATEGEP